MALKLLSIQIVCVVSCFMALSYLYFFQLFPNLLKFCLQNYNRNGFYCTIVSDNYYCLLGFARGFCRSVFRESREKHESSQPSFYPKPIRVDFKSPT